MKWNENEDKVQKEQVWTDFVIEADVWLLVYLILMNFFMILDYIINSLRKFKLIKSI